MHPENIHRDGYDFEHLMQVNPALKAFVTDNGYGKLSIDYADQSAVIELNKALIEAYYGIKNWSLPEGYLCPPVPGRADYLLYLYDHLTQTIASFKKINHRPKATVLDIGIGANAIYPIIGHHLFGWQFVGSEVHSTSIVHVQNFLIRDNPSLKEHLEIRKQPNDAHIFHNLIQSGELFDLSMCNPPFHLSAEDAERRTKRKWKKLGLQSRMKSTKSFGGQSNELWYNGGEVAFLNKMIHESIQFRQQVLWFTCLVSRKSTLAMLEESFKKVAPFEQKVIEMGQGQKQSRFIAWTFMDKKQQKAWVDYRFSDK